MNPDRNPDGSCAADGFVAIAMFVRHAIGWAGSWTLLGAGLALGWPLRYLDMPGYGLWSWLMCTSLDIQKWGGDKYGPWCHVIVVDEE